MDTGVRDLILPELMTYVTKIYQIGVYMLF